MDVTFNFPLTEDRIIRIPVRTTKGGFQISCVLCCHLTDDLRYLEDSSVQFHTIKLNCCIWCGRIFFLTVDGKLALQNIPSLLPLSVHTVCSNTQYSTPAVCIETRGVRFLQSDISSLFHLCGFTTYQEFVFEFHIVHHYGGACINICHYLSFETTIHRFPSTIIWSSDPSLSFSKRCCVCHRKTDVSVSLGVWKTHAADHGSHFDLGNIIYWFNIACSRGLE